MPQDLVSNAQEPRTFNVTYRIEWKCKLNPNEDDKYIQPFVRLYNDGELLDWLTGWALLNRFSLDRHTGTNLIMYPPLNLTQEEHADLMRQTTAAYSIARDELVEKLPEADAVRIMMMHRVLWPDSNK